MAYKYVSPTADEKKELARALMAGTVFTTQHFPSLEEADRMMGSVFMPLMFGALADPDTVKEIVPLNPVFYEYVDKAGPRSINGYPIFFSMRIISWSDWREVLDLKQKAEDALNGKVSS